MDVRRGARLIAIAALVGGFGIARPMGQAAAGGFTKAQADAGRAAYKTTCASCHRADLGGQDAAPQLAGDDFLGAWKTRKASELYEFVLATMPPEGPTLAADQALGLIAFILQENGGTPGTTALTAATAASIGTVAPGKRPGPPTLAPYRASFGETSPERPTAAKAGPLVAAHGAIDFDPSAHVNGAWRIVRSLRGTGTKQGSPN